MVKKETYSIKEKLLAPAAIGTGTVFVAPKILFPITRLSEQPGFDKSVSANKIFRSMNFNKNKVHIREGNFFGALPSLPKPFMRYGGMKSRRDVLRMGGIDNIPLDNKPVIMIPRGTNLKKMRITESAGLAHEIGHLKSKQKIPKMIIKGISRGLGRKASVISSLMVPFIKNDKAAIGVAAAGSILPSLTMLEEGRASLRALGGIRKIPKSKLIPHSRDLFGALLSYAIPVALPGIALLGRKIINSKEKNK